MDHDYRFALAGVAGIVAIVIAAMVGFGREAKMGRDVFVASPE